jgi:hypothetical protein
MRPLSVVVVAWANELVLEHVTRLRPVDRGGRLSSSALTMRARSAG